MSAIAEFLASLARLLRCRQAVGQADAVLDQILLKLETMETKMATIDDLNTAADALQGGLAANDARLGVLATAISDAASTAAANQTSLQAEIKRLNDLLAAGNPDPAALQGVADKLTAMAAEATTEGAAIDSATTALAAAFPKAPPTP